MSVVSSVITFIMLLAAIRAFEMSEIDATCNLFTYIKPYIKYIRLLGLPYHLRHVIRSKLSQQYYPLIVSSIKNYAISQNICLINIENSYNILQYA